MPVRTYWSGRAWNTANRVIDWFQNVWINAQTNIASRMKWSTIDSTNSIVNEVMSIENN
jgi:hypothetical protein